MYVLGIMIVLVRAYVCSRVPLCSAVLCYPRGFCLFDESLVKVFVSGELSGDRECSCACFC